jgi:hypothetical protein
MAGIHEIDDDSTTPSSKSWLIVSSKIKAVTGAIAVKKAHKVRLQLLANRGTTIPTRGNTSSKNKSIRNFSGPI